MIQWTPPRPEPLDRTLSRAVSREFVKVTKRYRRENGTWPRGVLVRWTAVGSGQQLLGMEALR